ncbi:phospholipase A1-Ibeta2, chloroplastic-like [Canna indica]|uniref:Phospholipase A1-Ibeta2, chloroplastic-like n=1 Tax=Canna indica TaxID=4628 RepID=A0AAQ3JWZ3_9LILI|nr:phospholipase A1-Ibeta2, chloroplastic-like [Canna indica]
MGRRDIVIALRGMSTCLEWVENFRMELVPIDDEDELVEEEDDELRDNVPKVECGFPVACTRRHGGTSRACRRR